MASHDIDIGQDKKQPITHLLNKRASILHQLNKAKNVIASETFIRMRLQDNSEKLANAGLKVADLNKFDGLMKGLLKRVSLYVKSAQQSAALAPLEVRAQAKSNKLPALDTHSPRAANLNKLENQIRANQEGLQETAYEIKENERKLVLQGINAKDLMQFNNTITQKAAVKSEWQLAKKKAWCYLGYVASGILGLTGLSLASGVVSTASSLGLGGFLAYKTRQLQQNLEQLRYEKKQMASQEKEFLKRAADPNTSPEDREMLKLAAENLEHRGARKSAEIKDIQRRRAIFGSLSGATFLGAGASLSGSLIGAGGVSAAAASVGMLSFGIGAGVVLGAALIFMGYRYFKHRTQKQHVERDIQGQKDSIEKLAKMVVAHVKKIKRAKSVAENSIESVQNQKNVKPKINEHDKPATDAHKDIAKVFGWSHYVEDLLHA